MKLSVALWASTVTVVPIVFALPVLPSDDMVSSGLQAKHQVKTAVQGLTQSSSSGSLRSSILDHSKTPKLQLHDATQTLGNYNAEHKVSPEVVSSSVESILRAMHDSSGEQSQTKKHMDPPSATSTRANRKWDVGYLDENRRLATQNRNKMFMKEPELNDYPSWEEMNRVPQEGYLRSFVLQPLGNKEAASATSKATEAFAEVSKTLGGILH